MPRTGFGIKKSDVERAISGAQAAGIKIARIEIDAKNGRIIVIANDHSMVASGDDLDIELAAFEARHESHS